MSTTRIHDIALTKPRSIRSRQLLAVGMALIALLNSGPVAAMSTSKEVSQGRKENQDIDSQSVVLRDPFLTSWVNRIGGQLSQFRIRPDITYAFTILDDPSINAFAIKGGFVHVDIGLLNFVSADDELAAILGHEMGHVELHHVTKRENTNAIIGILQGIASILSVPAAVLATIGGELAAQKYSRADELQADKYGVSIMSKAGYDPQAAVDMMRKLAALDPGPDSKADKAFLDHPVPSDRIAHLLGHFQLDRPSPTTIVARAQHDASEGRYSYARSVLLGVSKVGAGDAPAGDIRQLDYALRESGGLAAPDSRISARQIGPADPQRIAAIAALQSVRSGVDASLQAAKSDARSAELELGNVESRLGALQASGGALQLAASAANQPNKPGNDQTTAKTLNRNMIAIVNLTADVFATAPSLINANRQPLTDMLGPLAEGGYLTPKYDALLEHYPAMTSSLKKSTADLAAAISTARSAVVDFGSAVQTLSDERRLLESQSGLNATPAQEKERAQHAQAGIQRLLAASNTALDEANRASNEMYAAQTMTLSTQLSLLDLFSSPERYEAFRRALRYRFPGIDPPAYSQAKRFNMPAGEVGCAAWLAFETSRPMIDVMSEVTRAHQSCGTLAADKHLLAESLEIAEGLLYEDYDDAPTPKGT